MNGTLIHRPQSVFIHKSDKLIHRSLTRGSSTNSPHDISDYFLHTHKFVGIVDFVALSVETRIQRSRHDENDKQCLSGMARSCNSSVLQAARTKNCWTQVVKDQVSRKRVLGGVLIRSWMSPQCPPKVLPLMNSKCEPSLGLELKYSTLVSNECKT